jgi:hypothetical protein
MAHPASSIVETYSLEVDRLIAAGETFRLDKLLVTNNTASPVLVLLRNATDTFTVVAVVAAAYTTASPQIEGLMGAGCLVQAQSADVYVTLCRSQGGA